MATKILIDGRSITRKTSGIGRYTDELIKGYLKHYGYDNITVILNEDISNFPYRYICCSYNRHSFIGAMKFAYFLKKQDYDIYHSGDMTGPLWHKEGITHILTAHDLMFLTVPNFFGKQNWKTKLRVLKNKLLFYLFLKDADKIISISQTTRNDVLKHYKIDSFVLREGINDIKQKSSLTEFLGLKPNSFFLYVGLGSPHKNIKFLTDAFLNSNTDKKLVICGRKHKKVESDKIIYTGWIEDNQLDFLYANCAAFIFPSLYEGFGLPILEALSYNCKVFSSNAGSLSEFSNEVVSFFDPCKQEELILLIENVDSMTVDTQKIKSYLSHFIWSDIWDEFHTKTRNG